MKSPVIEPLEQRIAPANVTAPTAISFDKNSQAVSITQFEAGSQTEFFILTLDHPVPAGDSVTVTYQTVDNTAVSTGSHPDFIPISSGTVTFPAGAISEAVPVQILGAPYLPGMSEFAVHISGASLSQPGTTATPLATGSDATVTLAKTAPTVFVAAQNASVTEGNNALFNVSLSSPQLAEVDVTFKVGGTDVTAGQNYANPTSFTAVIPAGQLFTTVSIPTSVYNAASDPNETISVTLNSDAVLGGQTNSPITPAVHLTETNVTASESIKAALPTVTVQVNPASEGDGVAVLNITRSGDLTASGQIDYSTADGTALAGTDYTKSSGTLNFDAQMAGVQTQTQELDIPLLDTHLSQPGSSGFPAGFTVNFQNPVGQIALPSTSASVTIQEPSHFALDTGNLTTVTEGQTQMLTVTIDRTGDLTKPGSVTVSTADGSAVNGIDYTGLNTTVQFPALAGSETVQIPILDASKFGSDIQFNVALSNGLNGDIPGATASKTITIHDPEVVGSGIYSIAPAKTVVNETDGSASFTITRTDTSHAASIGYSTADGTGIAGVDYVKSSGTVNFAPGQGTATVTVDLLEENHHPGMPSFSVVLDHATYGSFTTAGKTASVSIGQNAPYPTVSISGGTADEASGSETFTVTLSAADNQDNIVVHYATADGATAKAGVDYTAETSTVTIPAGKTSVTFSVPLLNDGKYNGSTNKSFNVNLTSAAISGGSALAVASGTATGNITSSDAITVSNATATEGSDETFTLSLAKPSTVPITVYYSTQDGSIQSTSTAGNAVAGTDYVAASNAQFVIPVNTTSAAITIPTLSDPTNPHATLAFGLSASVSPSDAPAVTLGYASGSDAKFASATINSAHAPNTVTISDSAVLEGGSEVFTLKLDHASSVPLSVMYDTMDGTAVGGVDYSTVTAQSAKTVTFQPGQLTATISVPTFYDSAVTADSTNFTLQLLNGPANTTLTNTANSGAFATGVITNGHGANTVTISDAQAAAGSSEVFPPYPRQALIDSHPVCLRYKGWNDHQFHNEPRRKRNGLHGFGAASNGHVCARPYVRDHYGVYGEGLQHRYAGRKFFGSPLGWTRKSDTDKQWK